VAEDESVPRNRCIIAAVAAQCHPVFGMIIFVPVLCRQNLVVKIWELEFTVREET
jgi:hypothetical protein